MFSATRETKLCPGMKSLVGLAEAFDTYVGVNLGGGNVGVAEHFLDGAEVGATGEEVGREAVSEGVRAHVGFQPGCLGMTLDDRP